MRIFCNEWNEYAAQWLRNLSDNKEIPNVVVSEKSISDLTGRDIDEYDQCHFFAGIGGWLLSLKMSGLSEIPGIWTGSPPCQPFSHAGKELGVNDERHLAPTWFELIKQGKPTAVFGEQVAAAVAHGWVDELFSLLEGEGYSCGFAVLSGNVVSAPHERKRIFFGAIKVADASQMYGTWHKHRMLRQRQGDEQKKFQTGSSNTCFSSDFWKDYEVHTSEYDKKNRICKPGTPLLVNGIPTAMGRISAYGNAIIPQVGSFFIDNFMLSVGDMLNGGMRNG